MSKLFNGDCLEKLGEIQKAYVDAIVTDPPYGLSFMGKKWDYEVPSVDIWKECLRVLKPGGYLLSFSSARTYHRMACNVEDAGFEIRDQIMWVYGSGFPKGKNQLKPSHEPIVMARKGGKKQELRIDDCRVGNEKRFNQGRKTQEKGTVYNMSNRKDAPLIPGKECQGRWPANLIHDGNINIESFNRFFYCAKASNSDRGKGNNHPTVKPIDLMRYLIRLVCPVEQSAEYMDISKKGLLMLHIKRGCLYEPISERISRGHYSASPDDG